MISDTTPETMASTTFVSDSLENSFQDDYESEDEPLVPPPSSWFENSYPLTCSEAASAKDTPSVADETNVIEAADEESTNSSTEMPVNPTNYAPTEAVGHTHPSPSWKEISSQVLPAAAKELLTSSLRRISYTARISYSKGRWHRKYSDIGNNAGGYNLSDSNLELPDTLSELPPFSSLPWIDRQLVKEWRTYLPDTPEEMEENEDFDFERARALVPNSVPRPKWQKQDVCNDCHKPFGPTRLRHHCRRCGYSFCQSHSSTTHRLPHLGYDPDVSERVCDGCKRTLDNQNLAERVAWRLARCRDLDEGRLTPYFETGIDSTEEKALRITRAAIAMAKSIPLGAQATVAVETCDVLRKYGLHGIYGIMLRQEFLAAADLLQQALGINKTAWPLSVHELSAAIFYALAQHRAMRGLNPEREELIHKFRSPAQRRQDSSSQSQLTRVSQSQHVPERTTVSTVEDNFELSALSFHNDPVIDQTDTYNPDLEIIESSNGAGNFPVREPANVEDSEDRTSFTPVCDPVPDSVMASVVFYAPIALNFIYANKEVDMQLLAAQQGWRLLYAYLEQEIEAENMTDRPASALFLHQESKIACLSVRGTATIHDVVTDIRQIPVPFPDSDPSQQGDSEEDWTNIFRGQGLALSGMASAAVNLYLEHIDSLMFYAKKGYRIRLTGHSLGGGVATMVGVLVLRHFERHHNDLGHTLKYGTTLAESDLLRVYAYGTPSCVDAKLAESVDSFVTTVVLHDDVVPRLTPTSCRGLIKHLLYIRETWVETHMEEDLRAVGERAKAVWAPRFRQSFTLSSSSRSLKKYCKIQMQIGKKTLMSVKDKISGDGPMNLQIDESKEITRTNESFLEGESFASDPSDWGDKLSVPASSSSVAQSLETAFEDAEEGDWHDSNDEEPPPQLLLEFLGGVDTRSEGIVIDGDEFFETEGDLVESERDDLENFSGINRSSDPTLQTSDDPMTPSDSWSLDIQTETTTPSPSQSKDELSGDNGPAAVVLEETPLPRMFVPGKIIHVYSYRGVYKAAFVPRTFRELRKISLAGNMLTNHMTKYYYESLLEVQTARIAPEMPPRWTAFDEDDTW